MKLDVLSLSDSLLLKMFLLITKLGISTSISDSSELDSNNFLSTVRISSASLVSLVSREGSILSLPKS